MNAMQWKNPQITLKKHASQANKVANITPARSLAKPQIWAKSVQNHRPNQAKNMGQIKSQIRPNQAKTRAKLGQNHEPNQAKSMG